MNINEIIESIISEYINENYQSISLDDVLKTIPKENKTLVMHQLNSKNMKKGLN